MRLGLIGDVHAEDRLLGLALDAMQRLRVERILCTGDLVDGQGDIDGTCRLLVQADVIVVRGNHDRWIRADEMRSIPHAHKMTELDVATIGFLKDLPVSTFVEVPEGKLLLCHGVGGNDMCRLVADTRGYGISTNEDLLALLFNPSITFMVGGHTHRPMVRRFERGGGKPPLVVVNPGTLARDEEPGFSVLDLAARRVERYRLSGQTVSAASTVSIDTA